MKLEDLFKDLVSKKGISIFDELRPWQSKLSDYFEEHNILNLPFIGIKIPTGMGKTLMGLLILKTFLDKEKTCAYITHTKKLVNQIVEQANELDIPTVVIPTKTETNNNPVLSVDRIKGEKIYSRAQAIRVSTYDSELLSGYKPAEVLVIDDADAYINNLHEKATIEISKTTFPDLYNILLEDIDTGKYEYLLKIKEEKVPFDRYELLMANDSITLQKKFLEKYQDYKEEISEKAKFPYYNNLYFKLFWEDNSRLMTYFPTYLCTINTQKITFSLPFPDHQLIEKHLNSKLILMSATLGSVESIKREFGMNEKIKIISLEELSIDNKVMGKRLIIPLISEYVDETIDYIKVCEQFIPYFKKLLFMLYSYREKEFLIKKLDPAITFNYEKNNAIENFKKVEKGYLISTGRYIGIDVSFDEKEIPCNVSIITKIPKILSHRDFLYENLYGQNDILNDIISRRLIQAFGRLNRDENSIGIYVVIDKELNYLFRRGEKYTFFFPNHIYKSMDVGFDATAGDINESINVINRFIKGDLTGEGQEPKEKDREIWNKHMEVYSKIFEYELNIWDNLVLHNFKKALEYSKGAIKTISKIKCFDDDMRTYQSWIYYLKSYILEIYNEQNPQDKLWEQLESSIKDLVNVSESKFLNKYSHQVRVKKGIEKNIEGDSDTTDSDIFLKFYKHPENLYKGCWNSIYFERNKERILDALKSLSEKSYDNGISSLLPVYERILKNIYTQLDGKLPKPTLSDLIQYFRAKEKICKLTLNHFKEIPDSFEEIRNKFLHGIREVKGYAESISLFMRITYGVKYVINDLLFSVLIDEIPLGEIQENATQLWLKVIPIPNILEKIRKQILEDPRVIFEPSPLSRDDPYKYQGKLTLSQKNKNRESFKVNISL